MKAIKEILQVETGKITIELPEEYLHKKVEIIILEYEDEKKKSLGSFSFGSMKGKVEMSSDFNSPMEDFKDKYFSSQY